MISDRLAWFAMGALFGLMLCGWPWHHRFSRYNRSSRYRAGRDSNGNCEPLPPAPQAPPDWLSPERLEELRREHPGLTDRQLLALQPEFWQSVQDYLRGDP